MAKETPGGMGLLLLSLLSRREMYGYEMIEELRLRSNRVFELKAGTLYPLLHGLEQQGWVLSRDGEAARGKIRRYYSLTSAGRRALEEKSAEWSAYAGAINGVLGGDCCGA